jgi:hypothetical protein
VTIVLIAQRGTRRAHAQRDHAVTGKLLHDSHTRQETAMPDMERSDVSGRPDDSPARTEERNGVRDELEGRLIHNGVVLSGSESDEQILAIADAVEAFEAARAAAGGDSMINTLESSQPEDAHYVLPRRRDDESVEQYVRRVRDAAESI